MNDNTTVTDDEGISKSEATEWLGVIIGIPVAIAAIAGVYLTWVAAVRKIYRFGGALSADAIAGAGLAPRLYINREDRRLRRFVGLVAREICHRYPPNGHHYQSVRHAYDYADDNAGNALRRVIVAVLDDNRNPSPGWRSICASPINYNQMARRNAQGGLDYNAVDENCLNEAVRALIRAMLEPDEVLTAFNAAPPVPGGGQGTAAAPVANTTTTTPRTGPAVPPASAAPQAGGNGAAVELGSVTSSADAATASAHGGGHAPTVTHAAGMGTPDIAAALGGAASTLPSTSTAAGVDAPVRQRPILSPPLLPPAAPKREPRSAGGPARAHGPAAS